MMRRSTIFLSTAAVLVLSAGWVVGRLSTRIAVAPPAAGHGHGWFIDQLSLTPDQRQKMDGIWADARAQMEKMGDRRHGLDRDRDAAIANLLTPQQLTAYNSIFNDYRAKRAEFDKEHEKVIHDADDRSRALLGPEQQVRFDAMKKDMHSSEHHGPGGVNGRGHNGPATQPIATGNQR